MNKEISIKKVREDAEAMFHRGEYYCSEAVVASVRSNFGIDMPEEMIAMASGFPVGIGKSKCVCGAVSGGVMMMGYFFGRSKGTNPQDPKSVRTLELADELQGEFRKNHKVLCCSVHTQGMDMASGEHKAQCIKFTGEIAETAARIIVRELDLVDLDKEKVEAC